MLKTIFPVRRRDGVTHADLLQQWEHVHAPHVRDLVQPLHYHITFFHGDDPALDGIAELWLRDRAHLEEFWGPNPHPHIGDDGFANYIDPTKTRGILTDEFVQVNGSAAGTKLTGLVKAAEGQERSHVFDQWLRVHAPNFCRAVAKRHGVTRYVVNQATNANAPYDGAAEVWGESADAINATLALLEEDGFAALLDPAETQLFLGRELHIIP